jgi:hypothetical protein
MRSTTQASRITCQGICKEAEISLTGDASKPRYQKGKLWNKWMEKLALTLLLIQAIKDVFYIDVRLMQTTDGGIYGRGATWPAPP